MTDALITQYINIITIIILIITLIYGIKQLIISKRSNHLSAILHFQEENYKIRPKFLNAEKQIDTLEQEIENTNQDFVNIYTNSKYDDLREIGYHYELIGTLIKKNYLDFNLVFSLFPFPDSLFEKSISLRKKIRKNHFPDFWENFEWLSNEYSKQRKKRK